MSLPRRAVIAITSATAPLHNDGADPTGLFISEALHAFQEFKKAGFEVDLVSEKGTYVADWLSLQPDFLDGEDKKQYNDLGGEFRQKLDSMPDVASIDGNKYGLFFASAGHAALIDFPHAKGLHRIANGVWAQGGVVAAVCHGQAIFPGIIDNTTGKSVIAGKQITGFTTEAEEQMNFLGTVQSWGEPLIAEWADKLGAEYVRPDGIWDDYTLSDGRVVTGLNPQSARSTAVAALKVFEKL